MVYYICFLFLSFIIFAHDGYSDDVIGPDDGRKNPNSNSNLIQNGSFELDMDNDGTPDYWHIRRPAIRDCAEAYSGACSLMFPGHMLVKTKQEVNVSGNSGDEYSFSFWCKTSNGRSSHRFSWRAAVKCTDGTTHKTNWTFKTNKPFNWFGPFVIPITTQCEYNSIIIWFWYEGRGDSAGWFDDVSLQSKSD